MNRKQEHSEYHYRSAVASKENLQHLTSAGWSIAKASLFYFHHYREAEIEKLKLIISRLFANAHDPYLAYLEFCQRIMLADEYINRYRGGMLITHAVIWFRPCFPLGYFKTKWMYDDLMSIRKKKPIWKKEWKDLAEAALDLVEGPFRENFEYWTNWFNERLAQYEINMLNRIISGRELKNNMS